MKSKIKLSSDILGLDLGLKRTGVARINLIAKIAEPLQPIQMDSTNLISEVQKLIAEHNACAVVVGLPRGLNGQETEQTAWAMKITAELEDALEEPVFSIDEALTTKFAEDRANTGESVDSVAAGILLEDFVGEVLAGRIENVSI
jgi:putative Holliday junction resolvase